MPTVVLSPSSRRQLDARPPSTLRSSGMSPDDARWARLQRARARICPSIGQPNGAESLDNLVIARGPQIARGAVEAHQLPEHVDHPARPYAPRHIDRQTLTSELVDDGQTLPRPGHPRTYRRRSRRPTRDSSRSGPAVARGGRLPAGAGRRRGTCRPAWCHRR